MSNGTHSDDAASVNVLNRIKQMILILLVFVVIAPFLFGLWLKQQVPVVNAVRINNVEVVSGTALCAGQKLIVAFDFDTQGSGVLIRDNTVRQIEPPKTVIFSNWRRFVLDEPTSERVIEAWRVPASFLNPETDDVIPVPPGEYVRIIAVSSASDSNVIAKVAIPFSVKSNCSS